jgi:hypothetical protein
MGRRKSLKSKEILEINGNEKENFNKNKNNNSELIIDNTYGIKNIKGKNQKKN